MTFNGTPLPNAIDIFGQAYSHVSIKWRRGENTKISKKM